jgi:hypothetical protein
MNELSEHMRSIVYPADESPLRFYAGVIYDMAGSRLTRRLGIEHLYEQFQKFPHLSEVEKSWRAACALQYFGLPLNNRRTTVEEEFFYHLRVDKYAINLFPRLMVQRLKANDLEFFKRFAGVGKRPRGRPKAQGSLSCALLESWMRAGLWLMTNVDRVNFIEHALGFRIESRPGLPQERVAKVVQRLKLLSWRDFRDTFEEAPLRHKLYRNGLAELVLRHYCDEIWTEIA